MRARVLVRQNVHTVRRGDRASSRAAADTGPSLRKLVAEKARLTDAVRSLSEEAAALTAESDLVAESKRDLAAALAQRDAY